MGGEPAATTTADKEVTRQVADAVSVAQRIPGFSSVTEEEVMDLVNVQQEEQTIEELVEEADEEEDQAEQLRKERDEGEVEGELPVAELRDLLSAMESFKDKLMEMDPKHDRSTAAIATIQCALAPYTTVYNQYINKLQQQLITSYFHAKDARGAPTPSQVEEKEIDDIIAVIEDDDSVSVSFEGFQSDDNLDDSD